MITPSPSVQQETEGSQSVQEATVETSPAPVEPAFTGPAPALWTGFGAFVVVFIIVILLIIRGRVVKPAQRKAARADFFEPAGESAEITFDEDVPPQTPPPAAQEPEPAQEDAHADADRLEEAPPAAEAPAPHKQRDQSRRSPFSNLFSRQPKPEPAPPAPQPQPAVEIETTDASSPTPQPAEAFAPENSADNSRQPLAAPSGLREMDDAVEARRRAAEIGELRRLEAEQETMRRRAQETAARARDAKREAEFERRKQEAALEQRLETRLETRLENRFGAASVERSLSEASEALRSDIDHARRSLDVSLEERFGSLARELHGRLDALAAHPPRHGAAEEQPGVSEAHFAEFADLIGEQIASLRENVVASIDALSRRVDDIQTAQGGDMGDPGDIARRIAADLSRTLGAGAASTAAARIQLTEILAAALPPNRYELRRRLPNNKTADALIAMPDGRRAIAVDARFPVEAFDEYMRRKAATGDGATDAAVRAETEFRRVVLRHLVDVSEGLLAPDETADCALMFTPSEHILSELHANFSDLVQESYRASVWIVSPASLMATLNTLNAVLEGTRSADHSLKGEDAAEAIAALRERITALENAAAPAQQPSAQNVISPNHWESAALHAADRLFQPATQRPQPADAEQPGEQAATAEADERPLSPEEEAYERLEREEALADKTDPPHSPASPRPPFPLR